MFDADKLSELSFDARSLASAYGAGLTPCEVVAEVLRRLRAADDPGIFLYLPDSDALMDAARCLGDHNPDLPLWGLPFAVKDNIDVAHWPTTAGCDAFAYIAETDAPAVAALRRAGALVIGKTNLDQFATGLVGLRTSSPAPRNAIDPALVPGGSSSGSAVAVAKGIVSFALGTDTAGSGRVPAALNGIVGLKPTLGAISRSGVVPACRTLDTISIFTLTTADARAVLHVAAFPDQTDAFSRSLRLPPAEGFAPALRLGVPNAQSREFFGDMLQAASFSATLERLTEMGFELREVDFTPFYNVANLLYSGAWVAERMTVIEPLLRSNPEAIHPVTREVISAADKLSAADAFRGIYQLAELRRETEQVLASVDMLCVPSIPTLYSCADLAADPFGPNTRLGTYTNFVNLLDLCGIAIPAIPRSDTRPGSVTFLGRAGQDNLCLAVAQALEQALLLPMGATGQQVPRISAPKPAALPDELALCMVGAHMSGLPLNTQVMDRGGRYLETVQLGPDYRLFALSGPEPQRPGLLRETGADSAIEAELWALPLHEVGRFLQSIPAPLGLGSITLSDGRVVQGFLCEAAATLDAKDITASGGWRAWCKQKISSMSPDGLDGKSEAASSA